VYHNLNTTAFFDRWYQTLERESEFIIAYFSRTTERIGLACPVWALILFIGRIHSVDKNPKRICPTRPFFSSYRHFTKFPAYHRKILSKNRSKEYFLAIDPMILIISWKFQFIRMLLLRDNMFVKALVSHNSAEHSPNSARSISYEQIIRLSWNFQDIIISVKWP
jgi:hypothetical protein